jgi:selenide,water dikinase
MERSQALGHCICDPRRPCPCDVFRNEGICPCAGERPDPVDVSQVRLTAMVRNAGCASKIAPGDLEAVLTRLPPVKDPAVICGLAAGDDAAIYRLAEGVHLVQTVDVFTPCVDDPVLFGRICAANCLSDIYAMGGEPRTALSVLCFPSETLDSEVMYRMLRGAMETLDTAEVALIGGHSLKDDEIKLGFAITGTIDPALAAALEKPQAGDVLVLTKPLGTGVLVFGQQVGQVHAEGLAAAAVSMASLNRAAAQAMTKAGASACTDVTGFGLFGHLARMLRPGGWSADLYAESLPALPGALELLRQGVVPGAVERNREYVGSEIIVEPGVEEAFFYLGLDAQTSGGLLLAIAPDKLPQLLAGLSTSGVAGAVIGRIVPAQTARMTLRAGQFSVNPDMGILRDMKNSMPASDPKSLSPAPPASAGCCCPAGPETGTVPGTAPEAAKAFGGLLQAVQAEGVLNARTKELILFSQVVLSRCEPCFKVHYRRARELGISPEELEEAAWCAVAMGGAPVRLFYLENLKGLS